MTAINGVILGVPGGKGVTVINGVISGALGGRGKTAINGVTLGEPGEKEIPLLLTIGEVFVDPGVKEIPVSHYNNDAQYIRKINQLN